VRSLLLASLCLLLGGCLGLSDGVVAVTDVDGSSDHRLFRIGAATRVMLEPVLWRLEDRKLIDFDRSVTDYFKDELPPEFKTVTLRMLHDNESGLPMDLMDGYSLHDMYTAFMSNAFGTDRWREFNSREAFVARLWDVRYREAVKRREPQRSTVGYALMMMAISDHLNKTLDELCFEHLVKPYGLKDTAFVPEHGMRNRLTRPCAGWLPWVSFSGAEVLDHRGEGETFLFSSGMLTSASDMLKVAFVLKPHLDRAKAVFDTYELDCDRTILYCCAETYGGRVFIAFEPQDRHVGLMLRNDSGYRLKDGFELMENLVNPPKE